VAIIFKAKSNPMKLNRSTLGAIAMAFALSLPACKKGDSPLPKDDDKQTTQSVTVQSDDQTRFSAEMESTDAEIIAAVEANADFTGRMDGAASTASTCNAIVTLENTTTLRKMTITFNGTDCIGTGSRTGTVVISMPLNTRWKDAGAVMTVQISDLAISRLSDGKKMTINGTRKLTNVTGGKMTQLFSLPGITHTITSSNMVVTFDDGTTRNWQVARKRVFTYNGGVVLTVTGTHEAGGVTGITEWGSNRLGAAFTSAITMPLVFRQDCNFRLTAGSVTHRTGPFTAAINFGLNAGGTPTSCPGTGSFYYKLAWTGANGTTKSVIHPY
jgi:hypothetical protein